MGGILNILKYLLMFFNFVIFVVGVIVFGIAVWVLVDAPKFTELFAKTKDVVSAETEVDISGLEFNIYTTVLYAFLVIAGFFVIVSFFGCCGAWKENKCFLGIYFIIVLVLFVGVIIFGILVYKGDLFNQLEKPFYESLKLYKDDSFGEDSSKELALKNLWNTVQTDLKCCGVTNADDWRLNVTDPKWTGQHNKPEGCCKWKIGNPATDISSDETEMEKCRSARFTFSEDPSTPYYFDGCLSKFKEQVTNNKELVIWISLSAMIALVATLLVTMALCMTVE